VFGWRKPKPTEVPPKHSWPVLINEGDWEILVCSSDAELLAHLKDNDPVLVGYCELDDEDHRKAVKAFGKEGGVIGPLSWNKYADQLGLLKVRA
jgi:hypothetical protein